MSRRENEKSVVGHIQFTSAPMKGSVLIIWMIYLALIVASRVEDEPTALQTRYTP